MRSGLVSLAAVLSLGWPALAFAQTCDSLENVRFLAGEWISDGEKTLTREKWMVVSPSTLEGTGEIIEKETGSRRSAESLRLVEMSGAVFYVAKVDENPLPVSFRLVDCGTAWAVFENTAHDFPKRLEYRAGSDSLIVTVSDAAGQGFVLRFARPEK